MPYSQSISGSNTRTKMASLPATPAVLKNTTKKCRMGTSLVAHTYRLDLTKGTVVRNVQVVIYGDVDASPSLAYDLKKKTQGLWLFFSVRAKSSLKTSPTKR